MLPRMLPPHATSRDGCAADRSRGSGARGASRSEPLRVDVGSPQLHAGVDRTKLPQVYGRLGNTRAPWHACAPRLLPVIGFHLSPSPGARRRAPRDRRSRVMEYELGPRVRSRRRRDDVQVATQITVADPALEVAIVDDVPLRPIQPAVRTAATQGLQVRAAGRGRQDPRRRILPATRTQRDRAQRQTAWTRARVATDWALASTR